MTDFWNFLFLGELSLKDLAEASANWLHGPFFQYWKSSQTRQRDSRIIRTRMFCNRNCSFLIPPEDSMSMYSTLYIAHIRHWPVRYESFFLLWCFVFTASMRRVQAPQITAAVQHCQTTHLPSLLFMCGCSYTSHTWWAGAVEDLKKRQNSIILYSNRVNKVLCHLWWNSKAFWEFCFNVDKKSARI